MATNYIIVPFGLDDEHCGFRDMSPNGMTRDDSGQRSCPALGYGVAGVADFSTISMMPRICMWSSLHHDVQ